LKHGRIKFAVETLDDLWHLQHLVEPGNIVTAPTLRREHLKADKLRQATPFPRWYGRVAAVQAVSKL